jgi:hypothetical protein
MSEVTNPKWKQRDGTEVPVSEMSDNHLLSAWAMMNRRQQHAAYWCRVLQAEMATRAEVGWVDDGVIDGCDRYGSLQP